MIPWSSPDFGKDEKKAMLKIIKSGWLSQGKTTEKFESELSKYFSSHSVVVNNGSSALMCALLAHNLQPGDKVIVPNFTFSATYSVPKLLGAKIILCDVDKDTLNLNPDKVEKILKRQNVKMVIGVDVAGLPLDIDAFVELSKRYKFTFIEDAAESFGSEYKKRKIGSFDHTSIFSFHIAKLITTIEGGCITSQDKSIIKKISQIRDHGRINTNKYKHELLGSNFRITDLQSSLGLIQLQRISQFLKKRNNIAEMYKKNIKQLDFQKIPTYATKHSYMMLFGFAKNMSHRNKLLKKFHNSGIDCRLSWMPLNQQPYVNVNRPFPNSQAIYEKAITLPIFNSMTQKNTLEIIKSLKQM
jgi:perosamine synthetase